MGMRIGSLVKLKRRVTISHGEIRGSAKRDPARILKRLDKDGIKGGVLLSTYLGGFRFWNLQDLEPANPRRKK